MIDNLPKQVSTIDDLWNFNVTSKASVNQAVDVEITVYDDDENVKHKAKLPEIIIAPNQQSSYSANYSTKIIEEVQFAEYQDYKAKKREKGDIPNGNYILCVSVYSHQPYIELNRSCENITAVDSQLDSLLNAQKSKIPKLNFSLSGSVETFSYFDVSQQNGYSVAHRNSGVNFAPRVSLFNYPFAFDFFYDTDSDIYYTNTPSFQFNFDTHAYQAILQERLKAKLEEHAGFSLEEYSGALSQIQELDNLNELMANPFFVNELNRIKSDDRYTAFINDSLHLDSINTLITKAESLQDFDYEEKLEEVKSGDIESLQSEIPQSDSLLQATGDSSALYQNSMAKKDSILAKRDSLLAQKERIMAKMSTYAEWYGQAKGYLDAENRQQFLEDKMSSDTTLSKIKGEYDKVKDLDYTSLSDPAYLKDKLMSLDQINKLESIVTGFEALQIGAAAPSYSEFSITGVLLNGLNVNYTIDSVKLIATAGKINDNSSLFSFDRSPSTFSKLYVGGFEQKLSKNLAYGVYVLQSDFVNDDTLSYFNFLEKNNAIATKIALTFFKSKVKAEAELAISYSQNKDAELYTSEEITTSITTTVSGPWFIQAFSQKDNLVNGSFTDKAGKLALTGDISANTKVSLTSRYIGAGFYTPGNPFLINDLLNFECGIDQVFLKNKITASFYLIKNRDNLSELKEITTEYYNMRGNLRINFPKLPIIMIDYLPNVIINNEEQIQVNTLSLASSHRYSIGKIPATITANWLNVQSNTGVSESGDFLSNYYSALNIFSFKKFNIQAGYNYNETVSEDYNYFLETFSAGTNFQLFKKIDITSALQLGNFDPEKDYQLGGTIELSGNVWKTLNLRAGYFSFPPQNILYTTNLEEYSNSYTYIMSTFNF